MLNNEYPPLGGGTATVNQELIKRFSCESDLRIDVVTCGEAEKNFIDAPAENIRIHKLSTRQRCIHHASNADLLYFAWKAFFYSRRLHRRKEFDLCFAWSALPAGAIARALYGLDGLRYVVRVGGPDIPGFERRYARLYPLLTPTICSVWKNAEAVIAKCQPEAELIKKVLPQLEISIIRNGVDTDVFKPAETRIDSGRVQIICVARLIERKGQRTLLQAFHELLQEGLNVELTLVGEGDSEKSYREYVHELGLADRVKFLGYQPREKLVELYRQSDIFVLASENEGMSVASLEALSSGLPLVITSTPGSELLVERNENGFLFEPGDVHKLTESLRTLIGDHHQRKEMALASRNRAERLSWEGVANEYKTLFGELSTSRSYSSFATTHPGH